PSPTASWRISLTQRSPRSGSPAGQPAALSGVEDHLAQPYRGRRHFHALVLAAELQRLFEGELAWGYQPLQLLAGGGADVGELLLLGDVDVHVVGAGVLPDDHVLVHLGGRLDEQRPALLEVEHRVAGGGPGPVGDQRTGRPGAQLAEPRLVGLEHVVQDAGAAGLGQEFGAEADQLAVRPVLDQAGGDLGALDPAGQRRGVGADGHRDGGLVDPDERQRYRVVRVGERLADHDLGDAGDRDDVARAGPVGGLALQTVG